MRNANGEVAISHHRPCRLHARGIAKGPHNTALQRHNLHGEWLKAGQSAGMVHGSPNVEQLPADGRIGFKRQLVERQGRSFTTPGNGIYGPKAMIINENAGSGGDMMPYMFRLKGLARYSKI